VLVLVLVLDFIRIQASLGDAGHGVTDPGDKSPGYESYLKAGVFEVCKGWEATEEGTPQGGVVSPLLANIYLDDLDWLIAEAGLQMVRYADDFVILSRTEQDLSSVPPGQLS
jgi:hypothetical protein